MLSSLFCRFVWPVHLSTNSLPCPLKQHTLQTWQHRKSAFTGPSSSSYTHCMVAESSPLAPSSRTPAWPLAGGKNCSFVCMTCVSLTNWVLRRLRRCAASLIGSNSAEPTSSSASNGFNTSSSPMYATPDRNSQHRRKPDSSSTTTTIAPVATTGFHNNRTSPSVPLPLEAATQTKSRAPVQKGWSVTAAAR